MKLTFAFCTFNRASRLEKLVTAMRQQVAPVPFELLAINNNSADESLEILKHLQQLPGAPLRVETETRQGIVPARNRAIEESLDSDILVFIDDDELPMPGLLEAVCDSILKDKAECVGGRVTIKFEAQGRPRWLGDELLGFLAAVDHGSEPFWIRDTTTPIWTANVAYDTRLFREDPTLRFDHRYNRKGMAVGGGEDEIMFRTLLARQKRVRYEPRMVVEHMVENWRLRRRYFLRRHYVAGRNHGLQARESYRRTVAGVPIFMFGQAARQLGRTGLLAVRGRRQWLRQAMNFTYAVGAMVGHHLRVRRPS